MADEKRIEYNTDRCKSIAFGGNLAPSDPLLLKSNVIPTVDSIKDTGFIISDNITWDNHIQNKLIAALKAYQFLKRIDPYSVSPSTKLMYYRVRVPSFLLYESQVKCPSIYYRRNLELFETECLF